MCSKKCLNSESKNQILEHSKKSHFGKTLFIDLIEGNIYAIAYPFGIIIETGIFYNNQGEIFRNRPLINWKDYFVSNTYKNKYVALI